MPRLNWESCKKDIRKKLIDIPDFWNIAISLILSLVFFRYLGIKLLLSLLIYILVLVIAGLLVVGYIILVHILFPDKTKKNATVSLKNIIEIKKI